jgi:integrase
MRAESPSDRWGLTRAEVEAIAESVVERMSELIRPRLWLGLVDAADVARRLGVRESWVYAHADELGAIRLGDGEKARLRFDLERVAQAIGATDSERAPRGPGRPRRQGLPDGGAPDRGEGPLIRTSGYDRRMPRPRTGTIRRQPTLRGISYGLQFSYRGERIYHHIGGQWEGWTEERVEAEREFVMQLVSRGEYMPQRREPAPPAAPEKIPTFQAFASLVFDRKRQRVGEKRLKDLEWRLRTAMDHFGQRRLSMIDVALADKFTDLKLRERSQIEDAAAAGEPLTEEYADPRTGRTHRRRRRGLSNSSINKVLAAVRMVLREAKRHGLIESNPLDDSICFLPERSPPRSFLEIAQVEAVFEAASLLDREERKLEWRDVGAIRASDEPATRLAVHYDVSETLIRRIRRRETWVAKRRREAKRLPAIATLVLAGPRVSELCRLDDLGLDLAARRIRMPRVKSDASERIVPIVPALHEILLAASADRETRGGPAFPTRNGTRQHPDNIRSRLIASVRERANELLAQREQPLIGHLTPHTLRRTFASILAEVGVPPRRAMYLLGHRDPTLTMRVYQQVLDMGGGAVETLEQVLGCTIQEAFAIYSGRQGLGSEWVVGAEIGPEHRAQPGGHDAT